MWDKLSMAEKAAYIRVGVLNGITSLNDIKKAYNTYADGRTMLPEVVVTPRMNYINYTGEETNAPTLELYKLARRDGVRANALLDMLNTTEPTVPSLPSPLGRMFKRIAGDWYDDKDVKFIFGTDKNPNTCLSTVTSKYGRTISGNKTFRNNYRNYGFIEVPEGERDHGDIVQTIGRRGVPSHAAMVSGFTKDGKMLIDLSRGGVTSETIKHDVDYYDTKPELKKKKYYRFVGNKADNSLWEKEYKEKYNKFDDGGPKSNKVNYYNPITGLNYGDTMPEGMSRVRRFEDLTPLALDEYMANRSTLLDDLVVYPRSGKGAKSTNMGSYYDTMNTLTELNRKHAEEVAMQDALVRETSAFEKPLNFLSPGLYFGAAVDYFLGESPFWEGIYDGNSGWVSDNFAKENPRASLLLNMLGDSAFDFTLPYLKKGVTTGVNKGLENFGYYKEFKPNENNFYRVVGRDAVDDAISSGKIRAKTGWYHGTLNNILKEWGDYFNDFTIDELRRMDPEDAFDILEERMGEAYEKLPRNKKFGIKLHFRPSTNHGGTVGFVKGGTYYKPILDDVIIEGTPKSARYAKGHHGAVYYEAPIEKGDAVVMLDENTGLNTHASTTLNDEFSYYERGPLLDLPYFRNSLYWKHKKFKTKK